MSRARGSAFDSKDVQALTSASDAAAASDDRVLVERLSWPAGQVYALPSGQFEARVWPWPVQTKLDGRWVANDAAWQQSGDWLAPAVSGLDFQVRADPQQDDADRLVRLSLPGDVTADVGVATELGAAADRFDGSRVDYGQVAVDSTPVGPVIAWPPTASGAG